MEFKDHLTIFTPSEVRWAQDATKLLDRMPELSQKILDARVEFAQRQLPRYQAPSVSIRAAQNDILANAELSEAIHYLHDVALQHARTADNQEKHIIPVAMTGEEKQGLLALARQDYAFVQGRLETPELTAIENQAVKDEFDMLIATSDLLEPDEATAIGDMLRDPEYNARLEQRDREEAMRIATTTASIITALAADLGE